MFKQSSAFRSYAPSLRLPKSKFPARPQLELRPTLLHRCTDEYYSWQLEQRAFSDTFTLHDGPPYANGDLHIGHALNKILKDIFNRFQCSQGKRVVFKPGWDCHGLPIELKALQRHGKDDQQGGHEDQKPQAVRSAARRLARKAVDKQMDGFKSWAVMGDWSKPYLTMDKDFELRQLEVFKTLVSKGLIFRQYKPVYWSPSTSTALAEAELEYDDNHVSTAAYIKFEIDTADTSLQQTEDGKVYALIWTTTPWTIPANEAVAFNSGLKYTSIRDGNDTLLVALSRAQAVCDTVGVPFDLAAAEKGAFDGAELAKLRYTHPLRDATESSRPFAHADFVSAETGTGLVHMAPGHGHDDYQTCRGLGLKVIAPVDDRGNFTRDAFPAQPEILFGLNVMNEGNMATLKLLQQRKLLLHEHRYTHKYPIDWRTKLPVIIRATAQWFANVDKIKMDALNALQTVRFIPESGRQRLESFVSGRGDWCISRQRAWGVPIPALFRQSEDHTEAVMTPESIDHIIQVIRERGIDSWWTDDIDDSTWGAPNLPPGCYRRGMDTMDVWFDSGSTWTQLADAHGSDSPAQVYLEGTDQHRGWFQSSLLTRVASLSAEPGFHVKAPFEVLLTHGFTLDQNGRKMSKSIGNVVSPSQIMDGSLLGALPAKKTSQAAKLASTRGKVGHGALGPDALRLWVASNDYTGDVVVGQSVMQAVAVSLHKYRVTLKWLLGVLQDLPADNLTLKTTSISDRIALRHLSRLSSTVHAAYASFEPYKAMRALDRYVAANLSSFFIEYAKDLLYTGPVSDRQRVQAICYRILQELLAMLMPVMPLLVAETLHHASPALKQTLQQRSEDPFRRVWRPIMTGSSPAMLAAAHEDLVIESVRTAIRDLQERARAHGVIGNGLECQVIVTVDASAVSSTTAETLSRTPPAELAGAFVISKYEFVEAATPALNAQPAHGSQASLIGIDAAMRPNALSIAALKRLPWLAARRIMDPCAPEPSEAGISVFVGPVTDQTKCPRCWRHAVIKEEKAPAEDQLCSRCRSAMQEQLI